MWEQSGFKSSVHDLTLSSVPEAGGVVGPKYRATRALHAPRPRALCAEVGRGRAVCAYPGRSVGRSGSSRTLAHDARELGKNGS